MSDYLHPPLPPPQSVTKAEEGIYDLLKLIVDPGVHKERLDHLRAERVAAEHARHEAKKTALEAEEKLDEAHELRQEAGAKEAQLHERVDAVSAREKGVVQEAKRLADHALDRVGRLDQREKDLQQREATIKRREENMDVHDKRMAAERAKLEADRESVERKLAKAKEFIQA